MGTTALLLDSGLTAVQADCSSLISLELTADVDTIKTASTDLLRIINDILDFSKVFTTSSASDGQIENNKLEIDIAPFSMRKVIEGAIELVMTFFFLSEADNCRSVISV